MGAHLLIESIGFKANSRCLIDDEWAATAFAQARQAIAAIDQRRLAEINHDSCDEYDDIASYKKQMMNDLAEIEVAAIGAHRQAAMVDGGNGIILLDWGGLSWGDSPGELLEPMSRIVEAGVFPDARWPAPKNPASHRLRG